MSWELEAAGGTTKLTALTSGLEPGSRMAEEFGAGIVFIVSGLKTLVETGVPLAGETGGRAATRRRVAAGGAPGRRPRCS